LLVAGEFASLVLPDYQLHAASFGGRWLPETPCAGTHTW
jgi:hypothetical protein